VSDGEANKLQLGMVLRTTRSLQSHGRVTKSLPRFPQIRIWLIG